MDPLSIIVRMVASLLLVTSGTLVYLRGGALAWLGLILASLLLAKHFASPSRIDVFLTLGITALWAAAWPAAWGYVRSTWESGEVVEISIQRPDELATARVWVLDVNDQWMMYYDAPPQIGQALLDGAPIIVKRGDETAAGCADATRVSELPTEERDSLLALMEAKYEAQSLATTVFYGVLGGRKDRIGLAVLVKECV
ncbi:MAG: hypothetical protein AB8G23_24360 [Myxococcota bacterium]